MKVAIDVSPLKNENRYRGVGIYTQQLIKSLQSLKISDFSCQLVEDKTLNEKYDLVHYPFFDLFFLTLPLRKVKPTVVTIHDVIPLVFPEHYSPGLKGNLKFLIQKAFLKMVEAVITDSESSKRDIFKYLNYPKEKIYVIPLAPGKEFRKLSRGAGSRFAGKIKCKYQLPEKFILYVGDVNYNKNIPGLIKAFHKLKTPASPAGGQNSKLKTTNQNLKLVLVGKAFKDETLKETQEIVQLIKSLDLNDKIIRLGWVPQEDLVGIYNLATVYCQPSFYEGFGLPVLEAMACGCPVVAANTSSLLEVCGEAAIMINPYDINDIARGINKVLYYDTAQYHSRAQKGLEWVKNFDWEKVARMTVEVYKNVIGE